MYGKLLTFMGCLIAIGGTLLGMRQYRQSLRHDMTRMHAEMNEARKDIWDLHVRISERIEPKRLQETIAETDLKLEPIPSSNRPSSSARKAQAPTAAGSRHD